MTKHLLAYQTMIIREARRCGGSGWRQYDSYFRQQVAGNPEADWATLNTSLYAVTFLAQGSKGGQSCMSCMESDHSQNECAMLTQRPRSPFHTKRVLYQPAESERGKRRSAGTCCFAWNQGECRYPHCKYRHACLHCSGDHPMIKCRAMLRDHGGKSGRNSRPQEEGARHL